MRPKKSRRRGSSGGSSQPPTPKKSGTPGKRGRPPSKSPASTATVSSHPPPPLPVSSVSSSLPSHDNHNHSLSPEHSRTSSSDHDGYQGNANSTQPVSLQAAEPPAQDSLQAALLSPRKLSKRQRKALIKSNRRSRAAVDESFVAIGNELSEVFQATCCVAPFHLKPIPLAADPSQLFPPPPPPPQPRSPVGRRRGRPPSHAPKSPPPPPKLPCIAALAPLVLPHKGLPCQPKPPTSELSLLRPRVVRRYLDAVVKHLHHSPNLLRLYEPASLSLLFPSLAAPAESNGFSHEAPAPQTSTTTPVPLTPSKRGRGRPPKSAAPPLSPPPQPLSASGDGGEVLPLTAQPSVKTAPNKTSRRPFTATPRELKGLVTWDAMMKAESGGNGSESAAAGAVSAGEASPLSLQILPEAEELTRTTRARTHRSPASITSDSGSANAAKGVPPLGGGRAGVGGGSRGGRKRQATVEQDLSGALEDRDKPSTASPVLQHQQSEAEGPSPAQQNQLLPPRKRYKGLSSSGDEESLPPPATAAGAPEAATEVHPGNAGTDGETGGEKRRSRGRPSKKAASPTCGRPKREAADVGFASMVASDLNETATVLLLEDESTTAVIKKDESAAAAAAAQTSTSSSSPPSHHQPARRGRKPKRSAANAAAGSPQGTPPKPRGRPPKHPKAPLPVGGAESVQVVKSAEQMAADIFIELKPPSMVSPESGGEAAATTPPQATQTTTTAAAVEKQRPRKGKRGRPPSNLIAPGDNAVAVAAATASSPPLKKRSLEPSARADVENEQSVLVHASRQLRLFLLRTHHAFQRGRQGNMHPGGPGQGFPGGPSTTQALLASGPLAPLPSATAFFPLSTTTCPEETATEVPPLRRLLTRLIDTPDLEDPGTRQAAPFLTPPHPLRLPDFYRFICSAGLLSSFEGIVEQEACRRLQTRILATVAPDVVLMSEEGASPPPPFEPGGEGQWPPLCLLDVTAALERGRLQPQEGAVLDPLVEMLLRMWEAYAGRKSWVGRQLQHVRSLYSQLRREQQQESEQKAEASMTVSAAAALAALRKKVDRAGLERGCEAIRCLCGFRVEAGHVMVRCTACSTRQHLPCVWWALALALNPRLAGPWAHTIPTSSSSIFPSRCRSAMLSALAAAGHDLSHLHYQQLERPPVYFCPSCLHLDGLTRDYPQSLAKALEKHDVAAVFEPQAGGEFKYWSLGTQEDQYLIDEYALVHRSDYLSATSANEERGAQSLCGEVIASAADAVVLRIYSLSRDATGRAWMVGGAFLRPYDLPEALAAVEEVWHEREVVYDEASRVVLPLEALRGRCCVLSPPTFRLGRLADLPALLIPSGSTWGAADRPPTAHPLVFMCERLLERPENVLKDIAPGYLKVITKPYYFLRHPENSPLRAPITRTWSREALRHRDAATPFGRVVSIGVEPGQLFAPPPPREEPEAPKRRRRSRRLSELLPSLVGKDVPKTTTEEGALFVHGSRKSAAPKRLSESLTPPPPVPRRRGRPVAASPPQQPVVKQVNFEELQAQMVSTSPKKRGRKPKKTFSTNEAEEEEVVGDVSAGRSPEAEAPAALIQPTEVEIEPCEELEEQDDDVAGPASLSPQTARLVEGEGDPLSTAVDSAVALLNVDAQSTNLWEDEVADCPDEENEVIPVVETVPEAPLHRIEANPPPSTLEASAAVRVPHVCFEESSDFMQEESGSLTELPPASEPQEAAPTSHPDELEVHKESPPPRVLEDSGPVKQERQEAPLVDYESDERYQPISSASENSNSGFSEVSGGEVVSQNASTTATAAAAATVVTTATAAAAPAIVQTPTVAPAVSGSRRRKRSPKKRVFEDPERVIDLSAKSASAGGGDE